MDIVGIIGIIVSLLIAAWEYQKAKKSDKMLTKLANELPGKLIDNFNRIFTNNESEIGTNNFNEEITSSDNMFSAKYADVNNDGFDELLVQLPAGVHGSALQVYGRKNWEFTLLAELKTDTPVGFFFEDINKDGIIEVGATCSSNVANLPYAAGLRDFVWYRFENNRFIEVKRILPTKEEIEEKLNEFKE